MSPLFVSFPQSELQPIPASPIGIPRSLGRSLYPLCQPHLCACSSHVSTPEAGLVHPCLHRPAGEQTSMGMPTGTSAVFGGLGSMALGWPGSAQPNQALSVAALRLPGSMWPSEALVGFVLRTGFCTGRKGFSRGGAQAWDLCSGGSPWRAQARDLLG